MVNHQHYDEGLAQPYSWNCLLNVISIDLSKVSDTVKYTYLLPQCYTVVVRNNCHTLKDLTQFEETVETQFEIAYLIWNEILSQSEITNTLIKKFYHS